MKHAKAAAEAVAAEISVHQKPMQQLILSMFVDQYLPPMSQASNASQRLRPQVLAAYNADGTQEQWCVVTGLWWPALAAEACPYIRAAHIMPQRTPRTQWVSKCGGMYNRRVC